MVKGGVGMGGHKFDDLSSQGSYMARQSDNSFMVKGNKNGLNDLMKSEAIAEKDNESEEEEVMMKQE